MSPADVGNASDPPDPVEPSALFGAFCHENNFIDYFFERIDKTLDKCPALVREKILFLSICTTRFTPNEYHC